jgi:hypothetical protein
MFCNYCGTKLINGDCNYCFDNKNALKEFEEENER